MTVAREFSFSEAEVREWCRAAGDHNQLHLNEVAVSEMPLFEKRVVPAMMLLDKVSGLITQWGEVEDSDATPVISKMDDITFYQPVYFDEDVQIRLEKVAEDDRISLQFTVADSIAAEPRADGTVEILLI